MALPVSLLVITRNEERHIAECIGSAHWCEDKLVVDSGSDDQTVRRAEEAGARVLEHPFRTHAQQRNWALPHLKHRWVLCLDADERATPELEAQVARVLSKPQAAWRLPRRNWLLGDFIRHGSWGKDRVTRLFDRDRCRFEERRIHESITTRGPVGDLHAPILHYTLEDLGEYMRRADSYARLGARDAADRGRKASLHSLALRPALRFLRSYVLLWGFLDGKRGLIQAWLAAYGAWMKYLYLYELQQDRDRKTGPRRSEP